MLGVAAFVSYNVSRDINLGTRYTGGAPWRERGQSLHKACSLRSCIASGAMSASLALQSNLPCIRCAAWPVAPAIAEGKLWCWPAQTVCSTREQLYEGRVTNCIALQLYCVLGNICELWFS